MLKNHLNFGICKNLKISFKNAIQLLLNLHKKRVKLSAAALLSAGIQNGAGYSCPSEVKTMA